MSKPAWCAMPSTSIEKTEYDAASRVLSVWFVASGKRYDFEEVPPETYAAFRSAFVKGRFFNNHIRSHFRYRRIPD
ncbi:KTSC domain-containing protein [Mesorhizobium sp. B4-1-3]|uniref:KTSC domain-containing protein n=1 Tax=Mesorhizobium sp. B4-1-3 TaxID=2589889 RepID=UPI0032B1BA3C